MLISYREALNQAMREEMRRDDRIFLIGEEVGYYQGAFKVSKGFVEEFGTQRVLDTPITEAGFTGLAIGAAMAGLRPIVELMTFNFGILALDQIVNNAAKIRYMSGGQLAVPMVIRGPGSAAHQLGAQHSQSLEAWFCHVPGLKVVAPATPFDAKGLIKSAIRDENPVIFLEAQLLYPVQGEVGDGDYTIPLGVAEVKRPGTDVTLIAYSKMLLVALEAAGKLAQEGIQAEVIDPRTLRPLDAFLGQLPGRFQRHQQHFGIGDERHVGPRSLHLRDAERDRVVAVSDFALHGIQQLSLDEDDGVLVPDRALDEPLGVMRRCGRHHFQARHVAEPRFQTLRMLGPQLVRRRARAPDHDGDAELSSGHVADLRRVVDDLIHRQEGKVERHHLDDRAESRHGRPDGQAGEAQLGDRRVHDATRTKFFQEPLADLEGALVIGHILPYQEDSVVPAHLLAQGLVQRFPV